MIKKFIIPIVIFVLVLLVVGTNLGKPFWGEHDWNGARYGNIAKNYLRYGLLETKFGQVENGGISKPSDFIYYTHYQPLLSLFIAGSYKIFGISEFATRIVPLLATAGLMILIYLIAKSLWSFGAGLFASFAALLTPMVRYYGKNPVHEPLAAFFGALSFYGAVRIKKKEKHGWLIMILGLVLTAMTNWSFVFLIPGLTIFLFEKKLLRSLIKIWIVGIVLGVLHFVHAYILTGSVFGGGLVGALLLRTSLDQSTTSFGIFQYISRIRLWSSTLFTNTLLIISFAGLIIMSFRKNRKDLRLIIGTLVFSFYSIFFANASFIHSYFIYYFILPLSLLSGYAFHKISKFNPRFTLLLTVLPFIIFFERNSYFIALNQSSGDELAVQAGKMINILTKPADLILVEPPEYAESRLPILSYYSERNIISGGEANWKVVISGNSLNAVKIK